MSRTQDILARVASELQDITGYGSANVMVVAQPMFLVGFGPDRFAQVHAGPAQYLHRGNCLYAQQEISVSLFLRLDMDRTNDEIMRLTDATYGLYAAMDDVFSKLNHNDLGGKLAVVLLPTRIDAASTGPEGLAADWSKLTATWTCRYQVTYG